MRGRNSEWMSMMSDRDNLFNGVPFLLVQFYLLFYCINFDRSIFTAVVLLYIIVRMRLTSMCWCFSVLLVSCKCPWAFFFFMYGGLTLCLSPTSHGHCCVSRSTSLLLRAPLGWDLLVLICLKCFFFVRTSDLTYRTTFPCSVDTLRLKNCQTLITADTVPQYSFFNKLRYKVKQSTLEMVWTPVEGRSWVCW